MNNEQLRKTIMNQQELIASKRRFGLFSQPPPLAIGDNGQYQSELHKRGEDGKPKTQARNLLAGPLKTGVTKSSYFHVPQSIHINDPYKNQYKRDLQYFNAMHSRSNFHQLQFKPSSGVKTLATASYEYKELNQTRKPFPQKNETGRIKTKDRNIVTNPISKVEKELMKFPKYIEDPYERKAMIQSQERELRNKKMPDAIFKSMSYGQRPFIRDKVTYGEDEKAKSILKNKTVSQKMMKTFQHEAEFKPARRGHGDPLGRYPEFIGRKSHEVLPPKKKIQKGDRQTWKPNNFSLSRPTPSITLHRSNIGFFKKR